ncbi:MAG: class I tRNA ligase family protein [Patescibacteria group bacterium]
MRAYDHSKIEKKWQKVWDKNKLHKTPDTTKGKDNFYLLVEFPYPSGNLHVGHWYAFAVPDILARMLRMKGKNVLYPIGFDAFGLPAENAAIKNRLNPRKWTEGNIAYMKKQIHSMGASFDWSREVVTCDPAYYKWTQWLFLQLFKAGLVYRKETAVNWCPKDKTVLANEQVVDGKCERCDSEVIQKQMLQWNIKITDYADRLIDDLEPLDWPKEIKDSQRNWIGRSEGAEIDFPLTGIKDVKRIVLLHGRQGSANTEFFPWLKKRLEQLGYEVQAPHLPNPDEPDDEEQADFVEKHCTFDEDTAILGHSFGGVVALRLLERGIKVKRTLLVATPLSGTYLDKKKRPSVTKALKKGFDFDKLKKQSSFALLYDMGDKTVPMSDGELFARKLNGYLMRGHGIEAHFTADQEPDVLMMCAPTIRVFTTRADTLFGGTYLVLAPEHPWVTLALDEKHDVLKNKTEVKAYVEKAKKKTDLERQTDQKEKTGAELKGVKAINPATGKEIPVWVADFVLGHYGTGAVMGVPAHDERDHAFAMRFNLIVKPVIEPLVIGKAGADAFHTNEVAIDRNCVIAILKHWSEDKYLCLDWKFYDLKYFVSGGIEAEEDEITAGLREIREETGYTKVRFVRKLGATIHTYFFQPLKKQNTRGHFVPLLFQLEDGTQEEVSEREKSLHSAVWVDADKVANHINSADAQIAWKRAQGDVCYAGKGILFDSGEFSGLTSDEAIPKIAEKFGRKKTTYKLRDWIVSRQRYWGVPIPIIHCPKCGVVPVPDKDLPVKLPEVKDYLPEGSGKSPLAKATKWVKVKCPQCKGTAERETDTLDTFVDSSWYFLRYTDPKNTKKFADAKKMEHWMPVDLYSGGAEHTTMHLLYSRFWQKALFDLGLVADSEPYLRRMSHGIILGPDHQKMSKSHGNVIDPDELVERLGADTVRMYLAFIGPYNEVSSFPWNPDGVVGVRRFLERVQRLSEKIRTSDVRILEGVLHKTIKKVGEDIAALKFNTAISQLMIFLNAIEKEGGAGKGQWESFLKLLAPFAPHIAEELWAVSGRKGSIHKEMWPTYDEALLKDATVTLAVQINGKTQGETSVAADASREAQESAARAAVVGRLEGKSIRRTIVVPGRLVNFVVAD